IAATQRRTKPGRTPSPVSGTAKTASRCAEGGRYRKPGEGSRRIIMSWRAEAVEVLPGRWLAVSGPPGMLGGDALDLPPGFAPGLDLPAFPRRCVRRMVAASRCMDETAPAPLV